MKKILVALLVFALVVPTAVASGPPPPSPPPPRGGIPPVGPKELIPPALDLADVPVPEELAGMEELSLEKENKAHELVRSLTDEQRASIGQLLSANPLPVLGKVGDPVPPILSVEELRRHAEAMKALLPEMNRWKDAMEAGLAGILTPEQYALYQDSLLPPPPAQMADVEPQTENDCYYKYLYDYYGVQYAYYAYLYAYYSYYYNENLLSYDLYRLAYSTYAYGYNGYYYAYYAYYAYYNATYAYWAWYYNFHTQIIAYHTYLFGSDVYSISGGTYAYYAYLYAYYAYIYYYYSTYYYSYNCYSQPIILSVPNVQQEQTQWCWAGTTEGILSYYGTSVSQCTIANYNWNRTDCCSNPSSSNCNQPTSMFGSRPSLQACLSHWGVSSTAQYSELSFTSVQSEINAGRPAIARWGWKPSLTSGHFLTVRGYDSSSNNVYYINPGDGDYHTATYSWFYEDASHKWTHSLYNVQ